MRCDLVGVLLRRGVLGRSLNLPRMNPASNVAGKTFFCFLGHFFLSQQVLIYGGECSLHLFLKLKRLATGLKHRLGSSLVRSTFSGEGRTDPKSSLPIKSMARVTDRIALTLRR